VNTPSFDLRFLSLPGQDPDEFLKSLNCSELVRIFFHSYAPHCDELMYGTGWHREKASRKWLANIILNSGGIIGGQGDRNGGSFVRNIAFLIHITVDLLKPYRLSLAFGPTSSTATPFRARQATPRSRLLNTIDKLQTADI